MKIAFYTLGCKVNQYETQVLSDMFAGAGFEIVGSGEHADVYVVNSCTVTSSGDRKTRQLLSQFRRKNPAAVIALTGCFPQAFPLEAARLAQADVITGNRNRHAFFDAVTRALGGGGRIVEVSPHDITDKFEKMEISAFDGHTRAFIKIEDGCDHNCAYCIIPAARGAIRSKDAADIVAEAEQLAAKGFKEIVLIGINLASYQSAEGHRFSDIVRLTAAVGGIERVRLGSVEPDLVTARDLEALAATPEFCPQFHLSLQSGSDAVLGRMRRRYNTAKYQSLIENIRELFPHSAISTDIMVGFPNESDAEFEESLAFAKKIRFAKAHVFPYSQRAGTVAAKMAGQIAPAIKAERARAMNAACQAIRDEILAAQAGKTVSVLFETASGGVYNGYAKDYSPVAVQSAENLCGQIRDVRVIGYNPNTGCCVGELG